jgi:hypothetical protein
MIQGFSGGLLNRKLIYQTDLPSFQRDFASLKTLDHGTGPNIAFTRASDATFFDADGVLQTATSDAPRFDHDPADGSSKGLLIEEARTNSIRNSQGGGAVAGTPGTEPTNWPMTGTTNNVTRTIVGIGTENGLGYVDIKYAGTPTGNGGFTIGVEASNHIVAASGQTWTVSTYCKLQAGSLAAITGLQIGVDGRGIDGLPLSPAQEGRVLFTPTGAALGTQRVSSTITLTGGAVRAFPFILVNYTGGVAMDITLRIAAPQLEQGAFPTSYIPTTTAAATREADLAIVNPISSFYNQAEGTLFAEFRRNSIASTGSIFVADNETIGTRVGLFGTGVQVAISDVFTTIDTFSVVAGTVYRGILGYKANDHAATLNGAAVDTNTAVGVPTAVTHLRLGAEAQTAGGVLNGHIRKIAYWPKRLTDALLEQLTT